MNDLKFTFRQLLKNPGFTAVAVLTLALGIGANTAIFSVINTLLLRSLPVKDPDELVSLSVVGRSSVGYNFSFPLYEQLKQGNRSLSGLFAAGGSGKRRMIASGIGGTETEFVHAQEVTGNFFSVLGVSAARGRVFTTIDDQPGNPQPVVVISDSFWERRFGGDSAVIEKTILLDDVPFTIVGVTPRGFFGFQPGESPDLWWPMQMVPQVDQGFWGQRLQKGEASWLRLVGRVPTGVDARQAQAELDLSLKHYYAQAGRKEDARLVLQPGHGGFTRLRQQFRKPFLILVVAVGLLLLLACANIASLLLARAAARRREFSVRSALGAGRLRIVRQLLVEGLLLSGIGSLIGLLFSQAGTRALLGIMGMQPDSTSFNVSVDTRVLLFTIGASALVGLVFGLTPALRCSRLDLAADLKGTSGSLAGSAVRQRANQTLVIAQVALALVLLIGAGLFVRTLKNLRGIDFGFNQQNLILFELEFTKPFDTAKGTSLFKELLTRLEALPPVHSASLSSYYLMNGGVWTEDVVSEDYVPRRDEDLSCHVLAVGPHFFETLGTRLLRGRDFGPQDEKLVGSSNDNAPRVAVINQSLARRYFGETDPLGRHVQFSAEAGKKYQIVGVVKDLKHLSLREPPRPTVYLPYFQEPGGMVQAFALRTEANSGGLANAIRGIVHDVDPTVRVSDVRLMNDLVDRALHPETVLAQLGGFFGVTALVLACLGIYGVLTLAVVQRTREIGMRVALGAQRRDVLSLVIGKGLKLALIGSVLGLSGALAATRLVSSMLYGVTPTDPMTFACVSLLLVLLACIASWLPARRATRVDPMEALRCE